MLYEVITNLADGGLLQGFRAAEVAPRADTRKTEHLAGEVAAGDPQAAVLVGGIGLDAAGEHRVQRGEGLVLQVEVVAAAQQQPVLDDVLQGISYNFV